MRTPCAVLVCVALCGSADALAQGHMHLFDGLSQNDHMGIAVSGAGDVDNDGYADILTGSCFHGGSGSEIGMVRVHSGKTGQILYTFFGDAAGDRLGRSVSDAGDVDNDGFSDFLAGAPNAASLTGYVRIWSGKTGSVVRTHVGDSTFDVFGWDVGAAGDVDGDAYDDVVIGSVHHGQVGFEAGLVRVYSGATGGTLHNFLGTGKQHWFGWAVAGGGDADNDGVPDILGAEPVAKSGMTVPGAARLHSGADGSLLRQFFGTAYDQLGFDVAMVGDPNNDGFADQLLGSPYAAGAVGMEAGRADLFSGQDGAVLESFLGELAHDRLGAAVGAAGDMDQDGHDDVLVGSPDADCSGIDSGIVRAFSGNGGSLLREWTNHDTILTQFGWAAKGAGDVNNDGVPDVAIGAPHDGAGGVDAGRAWVFSGACGMVETFGFADTGSGGHAPQLTTSGGPPRIGNVRFRVHVANALGGASAALFISTGKAQTTTKWGTFFLDLSQPFGIVPLVLSGAPGAPGVGAATVLTPVPPSLQLVGFTAFVQALIGDPGSIGGIAHTAAVEVTVCE